MNADTLVQRSPGLEFSRLDEAYLAIDAQAGYCYGLNEIGGIIWERISAPIAISELCRQLRLEYTIDEATCLRDVVALLSSLRDAGLVQITH